jgi:hypothetical protein
MMGDLEGARLVFRGGGAEDGGASRGGGVRRRSAGACCSDRGELLLIAGSKFPEARAAYDGGDGRSSETDAAAKVNDGGWRRCTDGDLDASRALAGGTALGERRETRTWIPEATRRNVATPSAVKNLNSIYELTAARRPAEAKRAMGTPSSSERRARTTSTSTCVAT